MTTTALKSVAAVATDNSDIELLVRITAEFAEMPGLILTLAQAARLFSMDRARCERILGSLVRRGVLEIAGGLFVRGGTGRRSI